MAGRVATCRNAKDKKSARKFDLDLEFCQQLVAAFDDRGAISVTTLMPPPVQYPVHYLEFDGQVDFFDGKLASIQANLMDPWETVYQDLITSFGPPKSTGQATFQNDYGATLYGSNATWSFQDFSVTAEEEVMNSEFPPEMYLERVQAIARGKLSGKYRMVVVSIVGKDAIAGREAVTAPTQEHSPIGSLPTGGKPNKIACYNPLHARIEKVQRNQERRDT